MLISFGDLVLPGTYHISSRFSRVVNYVNGKNLISFVLPGIQRGPLNVVVNKLPSESQKWVVVNPDFIEISGERMLLEKNKKYNSRLKLRVPDFRNSAFLERVRNNLSTLNELINQKAHPMSYAFILNSKRKRYFTSPFQKALVERVEKGWQEIVKNRYRKGIELIKGTGMGFTPSGDDFITGFLTGLNLLQFIFRTDLLPIRKIIYLASRTGNIITDSYTYCAFRGYYFENIKKLLQVIVTEKRDKVERYILDVFSYGTTSGADFLTGLAACTDLFSQDFLKYSRP